MPFIIDARNMGGGSIGSAAGGDTSTGTRNNVTLAAPWDESKEYLKGDLATNNGDLYQAQKSVPAGVQISDEDYWALVVAGDKSKETEQLRKDIGSLGDLETESKDNLVDAINEVNSIQPDWNQNDENADGYIKNRPFYTESQNQTYDTIVDMSGSKYIDAGSSAFSLFEGTKYSIKWDDKEYESVCKSDYGILHIGNFALYDRAPFSKDDTGEPFCVLHDADKNWIVGEKAGSSHHIILSYGVPTMHMLPPKYIGVQSKQSYMSSDEGRVKYFATPDGNYELVVPEIPHLRNDVMSFEPKRLATFRVTEAQMNTVATSEYTEIECKSYDSNYNENNLDSYYVDFYTDSTYYKLLPVNAYAGKCLYCVFITKQAQIYCLRMDLRIGEFKIKRLNTDILDSITGVVTADKLTSPDHLTDLVAYDAFQAAVPLVQSMNLTGATVGQTIKVKAVDKRGMPTAWEAADMSADEQWELLGTLDASTGDILQLDFSNPVKKLYFYSSLCDTAGEQYGASTTVYRQVAFKVGDTWRDVNSFKIGCCKHNWCWKTRYWLECGVNLPYPKGEWTETLSAGNVAIKLTPLEIGNNNQYSSGLVSGIRFSLVLPDGTENTASGTIKVWGVKA